MHRANKHLLSKCPDSLIPADNADVLTTHTVVPAEEGRALLQRRVSQFGLALFGLSLFATVGTAPFATAEQLAQPWFVMSLIATLPLAAIWLSCRTGQRSVRFVRVVEIGCLFATALLLAPLGRLQLAGFLPDLIGTELAIGDPHYSRFIGMGRLFMNGMLITALALTAAVRAAFVPSPPSYTALISTVIGAPMLVVPWLERVPFEYEAAVANVPEMLVLWDFFVILAWWAFVVVVCVVISKVVYGLHQQVHEARKLGQYTLERKLGEGGMGMVYEASHALMRRPTAIKLLPPEKAGETSLVRFEREVQLTARLTHPNTVTIFDYGRTPDGIFYYAMELLEGADLDAVVSLAGPFPPGRVLKVLIEVAGALEEAHGIGLIHRDIKPANIILCSHGGRHDVAKLVDFGLVKDLSDHKEDVGLTKESSVTGTPLYMPPEALKSADAVDARSDLYALGAVGYYLLTGEHVFTGDSVIEVCGHHLHSEPQRPSERLGDAVPSDLEHALLQCLEKVPANRPQSAAELLETLEACESAGSWDRRAATTWWTEHGPALSEEREAKQVSTQRTIAIALGR